MTDVKPGSARAYLLAARPPTLVAAFVPVGVGAALASTQGGVRWLAVLVALLSATCIQIGTNYANDAYDFRKGADDEARLGPKRAAQSGWLTPTQLLRATAVSFALATALGLYLVWLAGPVVLAIGVASLLAGLAYTAGPFPLAYVGLGDAFVIGFFGLVAVLGTVFVAGGTPGPAEVPAALAVGLLANGILFVNNLRDRASDARVGKRTTVVRFGDRFGRVGYAVCVLAPYALLAPYVLGGRLAAALPVVTAPMAVALARDVARAAPEAMNPLLPRTAKLLVVFGACFALGLALGR